MTEKIKDLIISMVREEIETNPQFETYRNGLEFQSLSFSCYGNINFDVYFRFKPIGRGRKDNTVRFDVRIDRYSMKEKVLFIHSLFIPKAR